MPVDNQIKLEWNMKGVVLSDREINLLFEIFGPLPVMNQFTMRGDSLIGLGKSRVIIANQDELREILWAYLDMLSLTQQLRVQELVQEWERLDTKVIKFESAERVRFRVSAPEEGRMLIKKRIQTYIPIYTRQEIDSFEETGNTDSAGNHLKRG